MNKVIFTALTFGVLLSAGTALAQTGSTTPPAHGSSTPLLKPIAVVFPIAELGGCASKEACKLYCDDAAHKDACFTFAQTHGLMRQDEIQKAREFLKNRMNMASTTRMGSTTPRLPIQAITHSNEHSAIDAILAEKGGPGGCTTRDACKAYCDIEANAATCFQFAKEHGLMKPAEIELAKKLRAQVGPGGCKGEACKEYCEDSSHEQLCLEFAQQNGFISKDDASRRLENMKMSSTTRPMPPIPVNRDGRIGSSTLQKLPPNFERPTSTNGVGSSSRPLKNMPPPKPNMQNEHTGEQSSSVWYSILHFFWR